MPIQQSKVTLGCIPQADQVEGKSCQPNLRASSRAYSLGREVTSLDSSNSIHLPGRNLLRALAPQPIAFETPTPVQANHLSGLSV